MRTIEVRTFVKKEKKMIYGNHNAMAVKMFTPNYAYLDSEVNVMFFIGTFDKNGVKIHERDILKVEGSKRRYVVGWDDEELAYVVCFTYANGEPSRWIFSEFRSINKTFEIIGNTCENPELVNA